MPLVSIITPTYNREEYLVFAIESVLSQSFKDFEMLIIDDGSTDNTKDLVKRYRYDQRIHYFYQQNKGQSVARNTGLKQARGEYICFLDSDDLFKPDKLTRQIAFLKSNPEISITHSDEELIDEKGHVFSMYNMKRHSGILYEKLLIDNFVSIGTVMVRRECFDELGMFDESIKVADDYELWLRFATKYKFHYEAEYLAQYRMMKDQLSTDKTARFNSNKKIIEAFFLRYPNLIDERGQAYFRCRFYTRRGSYHASVANFGNAMQDYIKALRHDYCCSFTWRAIIKLVIKFIINSMSAIMAQFLILFKKESVREQKK